MVWRCPPLHLPNWNHLWKWKQEMNNTKLTDEEISFFTKGYFNIHPDADSIEQFEISLHQLESFARFLLRKVNE